MIKIAICDDDKMYLEEIRRMTETWSGEQSIPVDIQTFDNGDALIQHYDTEQVDILLLDIMMPLLNGMDAAREIRRKNSSVNIIFLTSSPEYAVESYEVKASGYLLKPVIADKLLALLSDCMQSQKKEPENITIKTINGYRKLYIHNIECIEAQGRKVIFYLCDGTKAEALGTFSSHAEFLVLEKGFFKCHRSYIVYIPNVDFFNTSEIITKSGIHIPIARGFSKLFKEAYFAHMFRKESD